MANKLQIMSAIKGARDSGEDFNKEAGQWSRVEEEALLPGQTRLERTPSRLGAPLRLLIYQTRNTCSVIFGEK